MRRSSQEKLEAAEKAVDDMARGMSAESLIDWLAHLAYHAEYEWGWIRKELLARIRPEMLNGRSGQ